MRMLPGLLNPLPTAVVGLDPARWAKPLAPPSSTPQRDINKESGIASQPSRFMASLQNASKWDRFTMKGRRQRSVLIIAPPAPKPRLGIRNSHASDRSLGQASRLRPPDEDPLARPSSE